METVKLTRIVKLVSLATVFTGLVYVVASLAILAS